MPPPGELEFLFATSHACYGAAWSPDGASLAVCGGFLYGEGFVHVLDGAGRPRGGLAGKELLAAMQAVDAEACQHAVIVSSLCWDDAGAALLASACGYKWHDHPPLLFELGDAGLRVRAIAAEADERESAPDGYATGCWLHAGRIVLRRRARELRECLVVLAHPAARGLHAAARRSALQSARLAVIDDVAYTAKNLLHVYGQAGTGPPISEGSELRLLINPHGLAHLDLDVTHAVPGLAPHAYEQRVNAVVREPGGAAIVGGLTDRTLVRWEVKGRGEVVRAAAWEHPRGATPGDGLVVRGVTALCFLADEQTLVSADQAGGVHLWRGQELVGSLQVPDGYSPRSLAAHPGELRVAVGCKSGRGGYHPGAVFVADVDRV